MDAESKLQAKLELLRRKKQQAAQKSGAPTTTTANKPLAQNLENQTHKGAISQQQPKFKPPTNPSAAREAAIKALKAAKQAAEQQKAKTGAPVDDKPNNNSNNSQTKIKFIIPKREDPTPPPVLSQQQRQHPSSNAAAPATFTRPFPPPPQHQQNHAHAEPRKSTLEPLNQPPKRPKLSSVDAIEQTTTTTDRSTPALPPLTNLTTATTNSNTNHMLFVGDLPPNFTESDLTAFFHDQFGCPTTRVRVNNHLCHGFVTFASRQDAEAILQFVQQQPIWYGNSLLRIMWARQATASREGSQNEVDTTNGTVTAGHNNNNNYYYYINNDTNNNPMMEHPRVREARAEASKMAVQINETDLAAVNMGAPAPHRGLVCYDDL